MRITVRIPTEAYAFQEVEFNSIEEYKEMLPKFVKEYLGMKGKLKKQKEKAELNEVPFK